MSSGHYERLGKTMDAIVRAIDVEAHGLVSGVPASNPLNILGTFVARHPHIVREQVRAMIGEWIDHERNERQRLEYEARRVEQGRD